MGYFVNYSEKLFDLKKNLSNRLGGECLNIFKFISFQPEWPELINKSTYRKLLYSLQIIINILNQEMDSKIPK